jgi:hypothetical protein
VAKKPRRSSSSGSHDLSFSYWGALAVAALQFACAPPASKASSSPAPPRFSWTPVEGADSYSIGVWTEVDVLIWRQNNVPAASLVRPAEIRLEPGTYLWSVLALREGALTAESGLAAFVVR